MSDHVNGSLYNFIFKLAGSNFNLIQCLQLLTTKIKYKCKLSERKEFNTKADDFSEKSFHGGSCLNKTKRNFLLLYLIVKASIKNNQFNNTL